jgi:hypothetical protein
MLNSLSSRRKASFGIALVMGQSLSLAFTVFFPLRPAIRLNSVRLFSGLQSLYTPLADPSQAKDLFDDYTGRLEAVKQSFREDVGKLSLTLSPKESFELRLRYMDVTHHFGACEEEEEDNEGGYKYRIFNDGQFDVDDEIKHFVEDDDRYSVYWWPMDGFDECFTMDVSFWPKDPTRHMLKEEEDDK